ncbi:hypothetical protein RSO01_93700 [Reyranella soli]|uniref:Uncharacterized protein n=1 Tax=Reyranella soli TaxID=1230389 RepID=A0A512NTC3_9HYPH|nr:hypothetical protein RSO01_93700 [Reyranella soli]
MQRKSNGQHYKFEHFYPPLALPAGKGSLLTESISRNVGLVSRAAS